MSLRRRLRLCGLAAVLAFAAGAASLPALAAEPPSGSTNFTPPNYVPDYFSNETGRFRRNAGAQHLPPPAAPAFAAPAARAEVTAPSVGRAASPTTAAVEPRHGRHAERHASRHAAHRKPALHRVAAHHRAHSSGKPATHPTRAHQHAAKSRAVAAHGPAPRGKAKRVAQAHG